jgi:hypothetical protein
MPVSRSLSLERDHLYRRQLHALFSVVCTGGSTTPVHLSLSREGPKLKLVSSFFIIEKNSNFTDRSSVIGYKLSSTKKIEKIAST